jgi:glycine/D-amino acid oxidase-like deaminating enzyme
MQFIIHVGCIKLEFFECMYIRFYKGMRPCPPDALPYMGKISGWSGAYINAGHNCWGIAWAPACGKAIAELVLEGASRSVNLGPFDPARFAFRGRGGRGRKKGSVNVGEQW